MDGLNEYFSDVTDHMNKVFSTKLPVELPVSMKEIGQGGCSGNMMDFLIIKWQCYPEITSGLLLLIAI